MLRPETSHHMLRPDRDVTLHTHTPVTNTITPAIIFAPKQRKKSQTNRQINKQTNNTTTTTKMHRLS